MLVISRSASSLIARNCEASTKFRYKTHFPRKYLSISKQTRRLSECNLTTYNHTLHSNLQSSVNTSMKRIQILLFGDSLTQRSFQLNGWGASLTAQYEVPGLSLRTGDVMLRGYSGYNSRWALCLLPHVFPKDGRAPDLVTLFFGANDAVCDGFGEVESKQHVPVEEFSANLKTILDHIAQLKTAEGIPPKVILIGPPPVDTNTWHDFRVNNFDPPPEEAARNCRVNENTILYASAVDKVGEETQTPTINLYNIFMQHPDMKGMFCDGLHFTPEGNGVVFEAVEAAIATHFPHLRASAIPTDFPDFKEIDAKNPNGFFGRL